MIVMILARDDAAQVLSHRWLQRHRLKLLVSGLVPSEQIQRDDG